MTYRPQATTHRAVHFWALPLWALLAVLLLGCTATIDGGPLQDRSSPGGDGIDHPPGHIDGIQCQPGLTACGTECVDTNSSSGNCGACGIACEGDEVCALGTCSTECQEPYVECNEGCANLRTDAEHCGSCGTPCPEGLPCHAGACGCPDGALLCGGLCVDPLSNNAHCGECGNPCVAGNQCVSGSCVPVANGCPLTQCDDSCVDTQVSALHCGACNEQCSSGQSCQDGSCECTDPAAVRCNGLCVNLDSNLAHCGECGNACAGGYPCTNGECACPEGQELCSGSCVDTQTNLEHCGSCGTACPDGETCIVGRCSGSAGDECSSTLAHDIAIREIAVLQAGKVSIMNGGQPVASRAADVIAGKSGVVRVYVDTSSGFSARVLSARLTLLDGNLTQVFHKRAVSGSSSESNWSSTFNIDVPGELFTPTTSYVVEIVECEGASSGTIVAPRYPESDLTPLGVRDVGRLRIRYIPINATNGSNPNTSSARLDGYTAYVRSMFPVANVETSLGAPLSVGFSINANGDGWSQALSALRSRHEQDNSPNDLYYYGLFQPSSSTYCSGGCVAGIGYVPGAGNSSRHHRVSLGLSMGTRGSAQTMAHELGHNHGRPHSPCGGVASPDNSYPHAGGRIGWWGFEMSSTLHNPSNSTDIMGYCSNQWVSDYVYRLFTDRVATINGLALYKEPTLPIATWRVALTGQGGPEWTFPYTRPAQATGAPEKADIIDRQGNVLLEVTVYRTPIDHLEASSILVPEPQPGWHAIVLQGEVPLTFNSVNASLP